MAFKRSGILCVVSGPSGSGKTTLCRAMAQRPGYVYSISCTTREPRHGEVNGIDYQFFYEQEFLDRVKRKQFLEYAKVHNNFYGTLKSTVLGHLKEGTDVLMDLDVQGAETIRKCKDPLIKQAFVDIFIMPRSLRELHIRLSGRGTEDEAQVTLRLDNAREEMRHWKAYNYIITTGRPQDDRASFEAILEAERRRATRLQLEGDKRK